MKSIIKNDCSNKELEFPKLMVNIADNSVNGTIVLFSDSRIGMVIHSVSPIHKIGYISDGWVMDHFKDFNGTVELSN